MPMATEDRPGVVADVPELHAPAAAEGDGAPAVLASHHAVRERSGTLLRM